MTYLGIVGSRSRNSEEDYRKVYTAVKEFLKIHATEGYPVGIVSGGCPQGADRFAESIAKSLQIPIVIYYAAWNKLGKRAGFARNGDIANFSDYLMACVTKDRTGGTEDTIKKFIASTGYPDEAAALKAGRLILV